jgi:hypothetical protein
MAPSILAGPMPPHFSTVDAVQVLVLDKSQEATWRVAEQGREGNNRGPRSLRSHAVTPKRRLPFRKATPGSALLWPQARTGFAVFAGPKAEVAHPYCPTIFSDLMASWLC